MANKQIKDLTTNSSPSLSDNVAVDNSSNLTFKQTIQKLFDLITSLTAKTTLVDADQLALADSAASNVAKKITWQNFMTQAAAYTQTLTNKTLTTPTIANFSNAQHDHGDAAGGGALSLGGPNILINGGMRVAQQGAGPFTSATSFPNNDAVYLIDGCAELSDGNDIADHSQVADTNYVSGYCWRADIETANKRLARFFPVENKDIQDIRKSGKASIQFKSKVTGTSISNLRALLLSWDGTADSITLDCISAWGTAGSDPTLVANWTKENNGSNLAVNTSVQLYEVENIDVDTSGVKNLGLLIMIDDTDAQVGDFWDIGDVKVESGTTCTDYVNEPFEVELGKCMRQFEVLGSTTGLEAYGVGQCASTTRAVSTYPFIVLKRAAPTLTLSAASDWAYYNQTINAFVTWVTVVAQLSIYAAMFDVSGMAASLGGAGQATLFGPNNTANAKMYFNARLGVV